MGRGRRWVERDHPRDDRGRFARTPGRRWVGRVLQDMQRTGEYRMSQTPLDRSLGGGELLIDTGPERRVSQHVGAVEEAAAHFSAARGRSLDARMGRRLGEQLSRVAEEMRAGTLPDRDAARRISGIQGGVAFAPTSGLQTERLSALVRRLDGESGLSWSSRVAGQARRVDTDVDMGRVSGVESGNTRTLPRRTEMNGNPAEVIRAMRNHDPEIAGFYGAADRLTTDDWAQLTPADRDRARGLLQTRAEARFAPRGSQDRAQAALDRLNQAGPAVPETTTPVRSPAHIPARRGDLVAIQRTQRDYAIGQGGSTRTRVDVYRVAGVTRDGTVARVRHLGDSGSSPAIPVDRLGRLDSVQVIPARNMDVDAAVATVQSNHYPGHPGQLMPYDSMDQVREALRPHARTTPATPTRARTAAPAGTSPLRITHPDGPSTTVRIGEQHPQYGNAVYDADGKHIGYVRAVTGGVDANTIVNPGSPRANRARAYNLDGVEVASGSSRANAVSGLLRNGGAPVADRSALTRQTATRGERVWVTGTDGQTHDGYLVSWGANQVRIQLPATDASTRPREVSLPTSEVARVRAASGAAPGSAPNPAAPAPSPAVPVRAGRAPVSHPTLYHHTGDTEHIRQNGFRIGNGDFGAYFGRGVYFHTDRRSHDTYVNDIEGMYHGERQTIQAHARVRNPFIVNATASDEDPGGVMHRALVAQGIAREGEQLTPAEMTRRLQARGYDSVEVRQSGGINAEIAGNQLVVFNPADVAYGPVGGVPRTPATPRPATPGSLAVGDVRAGQRVRVRYANGNTAVVSVREVRERSWVVDTPAGPGVVMRSMIAAVDPA